jgi:lipoprotein-anchoring transpeptidase ErfK/SrfK
MADYHAILLRAVRAPDAGDVQWRRGLYDRARQMLLSQLRAQQPPVSSDAIAAELSALDAAIMRIESELSPPDSGPIADHGDAPQRRDAPEQSPAAARRQSIAAPFRMTSASWLLLAVLVAAVGAGGYALWPRTQPRPVSPTAAAPPATTPPMTLPGGDLPPGTDGGSTDADLPSYVRRQTTFYRTTNPVGTIIVDKQQHYLYLIQPDNVAWRYGIGVGEQCLDLVGLRRVVSKAKWPQWQPTPDQGKRKLAKPEPLAGGPGNPLGARVLVLGGASSSIHGTNAPKTIGGSGIFGCIRLVNDDIVDLYNRVPEGTRAIVQ